MEQNTAIPPSQPGNEPAPSNQAPSNQAPSNRATEPVDAGGSSRPGGSVAPAERTESTGPVHAPGDTPARSDSTPTAPADPPAGPDRAPDGLAEEATPGAPAEPSTPARSGESEARSSESGAGPGNAAGAAAPAGATTDAGSTASPTSVPTTTAPAGSTAPVLDAVPPAGPDAHGTERPGRDRLSARLRRNPDGKLIAGVCTGMGDAWGIDPVLARLLFVAVGVIFFPIGPLAYVVFWMLMPEND